MRALTSLSLLSLTGMAAVAWAQVPDPTKPPASETAPAAAGVSPGATAPTATGVQAVFIRATGKSGAVINDQYVEVGGKVGDKHVVKISEGEVVLLGAGGREVIRLSPAVTKELPAKADAEKNTKKTKGRQP